MPKTARALPGRGPLAHELRARGGGVGEHTAGLNQAGLNSWQESNPGLF